MDTMLKDSELFKDLAEGEAARLQSISRSRSLLAGEYLFLLGDNADSLYLVTRGRMELCFPLTLGGAIRDVSMESIDAGRILGWSSLVKPYRFTLSARAAESTEIECFQRVELLRVFDEAPRIGYVVSRHLSEVIGRRLLHLQALWARELQRAVDSGIGSATSSSVRSGGAGRAEPPGGDPVFQKERSRGR